MVGRFDDELRRTLLYYYYCLVMGDAENAARYLAALAEPGPGSDTKGFTPRGRGDLAALAPHREFRGLLDRSADSGVGRPRRAVPDVLPRRDGPDGQGDRHLRGRRPSSEARLRRRRRLAQPRQPALPAASSAPCASPRRACAARRSWSTRSSRRRCSSPRGCGSSSRRPGSRPRTRSRESAARCSAGFCLVAGAIVAASQGPTYLLGRPLRPRPDPGAAPRHVGKMVTA